MSSLTHVFFLVVTLAILTLTLDPVRAKTFNQEQGKSPVRRWFAKRPECHPYSGLYSYPQLCNKYTKRPF